MNKLITAGKRPPDPETFEGCVVEDLKMLNRRIKLNACAVIVVFMYSTAIMVFLLTEILK